MNLEKRWMKKVLELIERGKQVGVSVIISLNEKNIVYTYAVQKAEEKYISYTNEYDLDEVYSTDWDIEKNENIVIYRNLIDLLNEFVVKYEITFDKLSVSKGRKFFDADLYLDLL